MDDVDDVGAQWEYIAWDVPGEYFGDVLGELVRTGWQIVGSAELEGHSQPVTSVGDVSVMQRIYAKRQIKDWSWERVRQRWR
ncbi:MAG: hypothetical protein ACXVCO_19225 [Ktedonobacterales bacterium]